jgi:hypothetical protein
MSGKRGWRSGCATRCDDPTSAGFESIASHARPAHRDPSNRWSRSRVRCTVAAKAITMASVAAIVPALPVAARSHVSQARDVADLKGLQQPNFGDVDCGPRSCDQSCLQRH